MIARARPQMSVDLAVSKPSKASEDRLVLSALA